jgi:hypothetical protein
MIFLKLFFRYYFLGIIGKFRVKVRSSVIPYVENKVEHKMNRVRIGHNEKTNYFSAKR